MARAAPTTIRGGYGRGVTTIRKIVKFSGGDALASTDASEPRPHNRRYAGCQGGLGRGRGVFGLPHLPSCVAWETQHVTMMEIASSSQWKNACAGQFLEVKPTLGVDFGHVVARTTHANMRLCVLTRPPEEKDHWPFPPIKAGWYSSFSPLGAAVNKIKSATLTLPSAWRRPHARLHPTFP